MWKGIDVSDNQGKIDWAKVKSAGCQFAILRSVLRYGKPDNQFTNNLSGCRQQGIPVAVYKYTYATTAGQAQEEACQVVKLLKNHNMPESTIVWWDVEDRDTLQSLGSSKLTALIQEAKAVIESAGYRFGIYTGLYVYQEKWFDFDQFAAAPLWVARYPAKSQKTLSDIPSERYKPNLGRALWGWQWSSNGKLPGISGPVDLNIAYQNPAEEQDRPEETEPGVIYTVSVADVWTKSQADDVQKQLADIGIAGVVHKVKIIE